VGLFSKLGDFVSDVGKTIAYSVAAPVNSVTGHKYKPKYETKVGNVLGAGSNIGIDSLHIAPKAFADTISGGYATKLANTIRKEENKETPFKYNELENWHEVNTGVKAIDKGFDVLQKVSKGGAVVIGQAVGAAALAGGAEKLIKGNNPPPPSEGHSPAGSGQTQSNMSTGTAIGIAALAIGTALALK
jgi:hypothetical protein